MNNAELERRLNNLIRLGTITRVDVENAVCDIKTHANEVIERPWLALRTGTTKHWNPPTVGEHVILFSPCGELAQAIVLTGLYTIDNPAPSQSADEEVTEYPDGSTITYNHVEHRLDMVLCEDATVNITSPSNITINTEETVTVNAGENVTVNANTKATVNAPKIDLGESSSLEPSVLGNKLAAWVSSELKPWLDSHTHTGNLGEPTSPALVPFEEGTAQQGGVVYSRKNRSQ